MSVTYLSLGSNLGDREKLIETALCEIDQLEDTHIVRVSGLYDTDPVGVVEQPAFLNAVAEVDTDLDPGQLLWNLKLIERRLGRVRTQRWGPRPIDLDILLFDNRVVEDVGLTVPHVSLCRRAFVLVPLAELAPDLEHPLTGERIAQIRDRLSATEQESVRRLGRLSY